MKAIRHLAGSVAGLLLGCAAVAAHPFASPSEPHGLLVPDMQMTAQDIYPVEIVAIDGNLIPGRKGPLWLKPGEYEFTVKLADKVDLNYVFGLRRESRIHGQNTIKIRIEEGMRYYLGAKMEGRNPTWKVVLWKTEPAAS